MHCKVNYVAFLARNVRTFECWKKFFLTLFLGGTIPDALDLLDLSPEAKSCAWVRSPVQVDGRGNIKRRNQEANMCEFPHLPLGCFVKAKGSDPPRTWLSALDARLAARGGEFAELVASAKSRVLEQIAYIAEDPKGHDDQENGGEWFVAFLREVHRNIYDDIDRSDPAEVVRSKFMTSESGEGKTKADRRHKIGEIKMPSCEESFAEFLQAFRQDTVPSGRAMVLAKVLIDVWMIKLVDYAAALKVMESVATSTKKRVVVVCYMGGQHSQALVEFWTQIGLTADMLENKGLVGQVDFEDDEARNLELPAYLENIQKLFPVPAARA